MTKITWYNTLGELEEDLAAMPVIRTQKWNRLSPNSQDAFSLLFSHACPICCKLDSNHTFSSSLLFLSLIAGLIWSMTNYSDCWGALSIHFSPSPYPLDRRRGDSKTYFAHSPLRALSWLSLLQMKFLLVGIFYFISWQQWDCFLSLSHS